MNEGLQTWQVLVKFIVQYITIGVVQLVGMQYATLHTMSQKYYMMRILTIPTMKYEFQSTNAMKATK